MQPLFRLNLLSCIEALDDAFAVYELRRTTEGKQVALVINAKKGVG
jgi:hypothetical protein